MFFIIPFDDIPTGTTDDTYKTLAAIIAAATAGHRCRIRTLHIDPSDDAPVDLSVGLELRRIADMSGGTPGTAGTSIAAADVPKKDPSSIASLMSGALNYSAEPTAFEARAVYQAGMNARGGHDKFWEPDEAPVINPDQLMGLRACPRGSTAVRLCGTIGFEMF